MMACAAAAATPSAVAAASLAPIAAERTVLAEADVAETSSVVQLTAAMTAMSTLRSMVVAFLMMQWLAG